MPDPGSFLEFDADDDVGSDDDADSDCQETTSTSAGVDRRSTSRQVSQVVCVCEMPLWEHTKVVVFLLEERFLNRHDRETDVQLDSILPCEVRSNRTTLWL